MRFLCSMCVRLSEVVHARLEEEPGVLVVGCGKCGAEERVELVSLQRPLKAVANGPARVAGAASRPGAPRLALIPGAKDGAGFDLGVPEGHCPKCVAPRPDLTTACPRCGLRSATFDSSDLEPGPSLWARWREVLSSYQEFSAHERFVSGARQTGELAQVGRLYQIRLAHDPQDRFAQHGRAEVLRVAMAVRPVAPAPEKTRLWRMLFIMLAPVPPVLVILASVLRHAH